MTEGDMLLPQGAALKKGYNQWPNGIVPFTISSSFSKTLINNKHVFFN